MRAVVTTGIILAVAVVLFGWVIPVLWQKLTGQSPPPRKPRGSYSGEAATRRKCKLTRRERKLLRQIAAGYKNETAEPRRSQ